MTHSWFGRAGGEVPLHEIRRPRCATGRAGWCATPLAAAHALDAGLAHQPGDLITADLMAGTPRCFPELVGSVDAVVRHPDRDQDRDHHRVAASPAPTAAGTSPRNTCSEPPATPCRWARLRTRRGCSSMNATITSVGGRAPPRRKPTPTSRSRSPARNSRFSCSSALIRSASDGRRPRASHPHRCRLGAPKSAPTRSRNRAAARPATPSRDRSRPRRGADGRTAPPAPSPAREYRRVVGFPGVFSVWHDSILVSKVQEPPTFPGLAGSTSALTAVPVAFSRVGLHLGS